MATVLVVEDEERIASFLERGLKVGGYDTILAATGAQAIAAAAVGGIDLILLDLGLPDRDGVDVLHEVRARGCLVPVIVVTARDDVPSTVAALEAGAAEYLTKPFRVGELLARIEARLRVEEHDGLLSAGGLVLDVLASQVTVGGRRVQLTRREAELLAVFLGRPDDTLTRDDVRKSWPQVEAAADIDLYIDRLASKLGHPAIQRSDGGYTLASAPA